MRINGFEQIKGFYSWVFHNQDKNIRTPHISLYMFLINQNNRNNWVEWFKCPYDLAMSGSGITNKKTYYKCLNELHDFGLIEYKKGSNNWNQALIKIEVLFDTRTVPQCAPEMTPELTPDLLPRLLLGLLPDLANNIKLLTNNIKPITLNIKKVLKFLEVEVETGYTQAQFLENWNEARTHFTGTQSNLNTLTIEQSDLFKSVLINFKKEDLQSAIKGLFIQEYVPQEVMQFKPTHFLNNVDMYLDAFNNNKKNLYKK